MAEVIPLALVNQALARVLPGAIAEAVEVRDRFVAHSADVVRLAISASPASTQPLPSTAIAKYCPEHPSLPRVSPRSPVTNGCCNARHPRLHRAFSGRTRTSMQVSRSCLPKTSMPTFSDRLPLFQMRCWRASSTRSHDSMPNGGNAMNSTIRGLPNCARNHPGCRKPTPRSSCRPTVP